MQKFDVVLHHNFLTTRELWLSVFAMQPPSTVSDLDGAAGMAVGTLPNGDSSSCAVELALQNDGSVVVRELQSGKERYCLLAGALVVGGKVTFFVPSNQGQPFHSSFDVATVI